MKAAATLVVGPSWVGDMVMAQALFKQLKTEQPDWPIDVLAPDWSLPVVARMPEVRAGIAAETAHGEFGFAKRRRIGRQLRGCYDRAIVLPRSFKSALIPWFAEVPVRTGFRGEHRYGLINDMRPFDKALLDQTVKRFLALGLERGGQLPDTPFPTLRIDERNQRAVMDKLGIGGNKPVAALMPGAEYGPAKCWPVEYFSELARRLSASGFDVWVLGSHKDSESGAAISGGSDATNLCGDTTLEDVIDLLAYARHAVSNDSGLLHIAAAVGTVVHAIYGSSTPNFTPPLTNAREIHWIGLDCSPCFKRKCPLGHLNCLRDIEPATVFAAMKPTAGGAGIDSAFGNQIE